MSFEQKQALEPQEQPATLTTSPGKVGPAHHSHSSQPVASSHGAHDCLRSPACQLWGAQARVYVAVLLMFVLTLGATLC